jgi:hypothetical protein
MSKIVDRERRREEASTAEFLLPSYIEARE